MQTSVPSFSRVMVMVGFALSCFGLLLFLWLSFGGPIPLKPKGYRVQVGFPEATQLGLEADVRVAGVSVGKLRKKELDPHVEPHARRRSRSTASTRRSEADARAILRQKSILGETYVELTPGSSKKTIPEGGRLPNGSSSRRSSSTRSSRRSTRRRARRSSVWQQDLAEGIDGRGRDFNDALGTLPGFAKDGADVLARPRQPGGRGQPARQEHRRDLRRADRERAAALEPDHLRGPRLRRHRVAAGRARRDDPDLPDLPRRVQGDARAARDASRRTRSR